ncbi:MAG: hypothetical protein ACYC9J_09020 [Sulfuricaulis sp.]
MKDRVLDQELLEMLTIKFETESVLHRPMQRAHGTAREQRPDGETFADGKFPSAAFRWIGILEAACRGPPGRDAGLAAAPASPRAHHCLMM